MRPYWLWIAPAAAQLFSLPPALESVGSLIQSLVDPTPTRVATPVAPTRTPVVVEPTPTTRAPAQTPTPTPTFVPPPPPPTTSSAQPTTFFTSSTTKTSPSKKPDHIPLIPTTSTTSHATTKLDEAASTSSSTNTATRDGSGGLSQGAKVGIGVGIALLVLIGLLAAGLYSLRNSRAWANFLERKGNKHARLHSMSSTSFLATATSREKEPTLPQVGEYGNGTILGQRATPKRERSFDYADYEYERRLEPLVVMNPSTPADEREVEMGAGAYPAGHLTATVPPEATLRGEPDAPDTSGTLEQEVQRPESVVFQQAREVHIRVPRKALPPRQPPPTMAQTIPRKPVFWVDDTY